MSFSIMSLQFALNGWQLALAGGLLLGLVATLLAARRRLRTRPPARWWGVMALNIVAFLAVFLLLAAPSVERQAGATLTLLTEGFEGRPLPAAGELYLAPGVAPRPDQVSGPMVALADIGQLLLQQPGLARIRVAGFGLDTGQWQRFPADLEIIFEPPTLTGITAAHWPTELDLGQPLAVQGEVRLDNMDDIARLVLLDPAGDEAAEARAGDGDRFRLVAWPKSQGNVLYRLQLWQGDALLEDQPVPVHIRLPVPPRILVIQSAPSFETRQLKDWATAYAASMQVVSNVSRGHAITQQINLPADATARWRPELLAEQDLLIMDGRTLAGLTGEQLEWLEQAIAAGLALFLQADSDLPDEAGRPGWLRGFRLTPVPGAPDQAVAHWQDSRNTRPLPVLPAQLAAPLGEVLVRDANGRPLELAYRHGKGQVAVSILRERFRWMTFGDHAVYTHYWHTLLDAIARPPPAPYLLPAERPDLPRVNARSTACAISGADPLRLEVAGSGPPYAGLTLASDLLGSPVACAHYWPERPGWQSLQLRVRQDGRLLDGRAQYVFDAREWLPLQRAQRSAATWQRIAARAPAGLEAQRQVRETLDYAWAWWLLVLSASALWLERKLDFEAD